MKWISKLLNPKKNGLQVGDWVNSYSKGIYRIEKIVEEYYDESENSILNENKIGDRHEYRTIITKRLLNATLKKSISYESCSEYFITKLNEEQYEKLNKIIRSMPEILIEFDDYKIPTIISIFNFRLQIDKTDNINEFSKLIEFIELGKTFMEIENEMKRLNLYHLKVNGSGNYLFQLLNYDFEYHSKRRIWRKGILKTN